MASTTPRDGEKRALTGAELSAAGLRVVPYSRITPQMTLADIVGRGGGAAILYETEPTRGHWVLLMRRGVRYEFFDSYGFKPDEELDLARYAARAARGVPLIANKIEREGVDVEANASDLQQWARDVATCGRYVLDRWRRRREPLGSYLTEFRAADPAFNDAQIVRRTRSGSEAAGRET